MEGVHKKWGRGPLILFLTHPISAGFFNSARGESVARLHTQRTASLQVSMRVMPVRNANNKGRNWMSLPRMSSVPWSLACSVGQKLWNKKCLVITVSTAVCNLLQECSSFDTQQLRLLADSGKSPRLGRLFADDRRNSISEAVVVCYF